MGEIAIESVEEHVLMLEDKLCELIETDPASDRIAPLQELIEYVEGEVKHIYVKTLDLFGLLVDALDYKEW